MSAPEQIRIERNELFAPAIEDALAKERALRRRVGGDAPPVSPLRALLLNSLFYLPLAAVIGALASWLIIEPHIDDMMRVAGDVVLVNRDTFEHGKNSYVSVTVGSKEALVLPDQVVFEKGAAGQPAFHGLDDVKPGTTVEIVGIAPEEGREGSRFVAIGIRPASEAEAKKIGAGFEGQSTAAGILFFPLVATLIALCLLLAEGITSRNWVRMLERTMLGTLLAVVFSFLAFVPVILFIFLGQKALNAAAADKAFVTVATISAAPFLTQTVCRSIAWACLGTAMGLGMNLVRSTRPQLRNAVLGGALGGALGGMLFDPIDRFLHASLFEQSYLSRGIGVAAVGLCIGLFVALIERLAREAWLRVRTGPLAGKSFVLYKTPTSLGSSPQSDIYLFKDAEIDGTHAIIHRVGSFYELEDAGSRTGTTVGGQTIRRRRLASGDQIVVGSTVLEFEERAKRAPVSH